MILPEFNFTLFGLGLRMLLFVSKKLWPISLICSLFGFLGCGDQGQGEWLKVLNSSGRDCDDVEIAYLESDRLIDIAKTKVADLGDSQFRFRFGYVSNGNAKVYGMIYNIPEKALLEWTEEGVYYNCLVNVPENVRHYYERNRRDGLTKDVTFEINPDRSISVYLYMQARPGEEKVYFPPREEAGEKK